MAERVCAGTEAPVGSHVPVLRPGSIDGRDAESPRRKEGNTAVIPSGLPPEGPLAFNSGYYREKEKPRFSSVLGTVLANMYTVDQKCHQTCIPQPAPCYRVLYQWPPYCHITHLMVVFLGPEGKMHISMISWERMYSQGPSTLYCTANMQ